MTTTWAESYMGVKIEYGDPTTYYLKHDIDTPILINDIAHALSNLCRYTGHTKHFYSVAEHSVYATRILNWIGIADPKIELAGLLHDAHEAYLGDLNSPLKAAVGERFKRLEEAYDERIAARFGVNFDVDGVRYADLALLEAERRYLLNPSGLNWEIDFSIVPKEYRQAADEIVGASTRHYPPEAEIMFLNAFNNLAQLVA